MKVLKFGGTSLATPESIKMVVDIVESENAQIVVVSAPGRRTADDKKITDLFIDCFYARLKSGRCDVSFFEAERRITELAEAVGVVGIKPYLQQIKHDIDGGAGLCFAASRGEYLCALILRHLLCCEFVDATHIIKFDMNGQPDFQQSYQKIAARLKGARRVVVPGFYGAMPNGEIKTFSRGGSDVTASLIAAGIRAEICQNWTDVDGVYFCPLTDRCDVIDRLNCRDMRELAYLGATVLHPDSLLPLMEARVPLQIKNTFNPVAVGTLIGENKSQSTSAAKDFPVVSGGNSNKKPTIPYGNTVFPTCIGKETNPLPSIENNTIKLKSLKNKGDSPPNSFDGKKQPIAVSGRVGFTLLSFYKAGGSGEECLSMIMDVCRKNGTGVFTALCGVDTYNIVAYGALDWLLSETETEDLTNHMHAKSTDKILDDSSENGNKTDFKIRKSLENHLPAEIVSAKKIAVITILGGDKWRVVREVCGIDLPLSLMQAESEGRGILVGVPQNTLEPWLVKLCEVFYSAP